MEADLKKVAASLETSLLQGEGMVLVKLLVPASCSAASWIITQGAMHMHRPTVYSCLRYPVAEKAASLQGILHLWAREASAAASTSHGIQNGGLHSSQQGCPMHRCNKQN